MKIVFLGTPEFAVPSLRILVENRYQIAGVVTAPDKPSGRGLHLHQSAVKQYAAAQNLKIFQPHNLKDETFTEELKKLNADLFIIVAFRMLPEKIWNMPPLGTFNLHASLLPQYRGAAPINHAIINGETQTGITTFFLKHEIDTGNIILQEKIDIDQNATAGELHDILMIKGANLVLETVKLIESGKVKAFPQPEIQANALKTAPKLTRELCHINWNSTCNNIHNLVRGLSPAPGAFSIMTKDNNELFVLKILKTLPFKQSHNYQIGTLITDNKSFIRIAANDGYVEILELQYPGKKKMKTEEFLRGHKLETNLLAG